MFNLIVLKPTYYFKVGIFFSLLLCLFSCDLSDSQPSVDSLKTAPSDRPDYLSIVLRADVEKLKLDARQLPTHKENFVLRSRLLSKWVDARALAGLPGSPFAIGSHLNTDLPLESIPRKNFLLIDELISEYAFRDEYPNAFGILVADSLGPFEADSFASIRQTWHVGDKSVVAGGGFWVARHFAALFGEFQTDDPSGEGYITIESSNKLARFSAKQILVRGPHGGFRAPEPALAFELMEGELVQGDTVTITYGNQNYAGVGLKITPIAGENIPLPVYVAFSEAQAWMMLPILPIEVRGSETSGVRGFAPSIVDEGEVFEVSVRAEDSFYNRADSGVPKFSIYDGDRVVAETEENGSSIQTFNLSFSESGPKWLRIVSQDGLIEGRFNPILVKVNPSHRIYWGDTHGHSGYAEGIGNMDYFMRFARDDARLDYVTLSEHDIWLDEEEWRSLRDTVIAFDSPGKFIPFLGYEWTSPAKRGGHHNILYRTAKNRDRVSALEYATLSELYLELRKRNSENDVLIIPHAHNPGDSRLSDPRLERLIEIMSMHGTHQWFANNYLSNGHQVGFVAASDDHHSRPGYSSPLRKTLAQRGGLSAVYAADNSRDTIFDALRNRQTYASSLERIIIEMELNGTPMGDRAKFATERKIKGQVIGSHGIDSITLFKNNNPIRVLNFNAAKWTEAAKKQKLRITFVSDSTPFYSGDAPRGWRHWKGVLTASGFRIDAIDGPDFVNARTQYLNAEIVNQVYNFATNTRGDESFIDLEISEIKADATLRLDLKDTLETGAAPPFLRMHTVNAGGIFELKLTDLVSGIATKTFVTEGYDDLVSIAPLASDLEKIQPFEFLDIDEPMHGDQYFIVAKQVNGGVAWSSPVWVGGYASQ